jgi:hypothetical protein
MVTRGQVARGADGREREQRPQCHEDAAFGSRSLSAVHVASIAVEFLP